MLFDLIKYWSRELTSRLIYQCFIVAFAYTTMGWLGLRVPFESSKVTLFWLPTGIAIAALQRWKMRVWPGIFMGALAINELTGAPLTTNFFIACGNTAGPILAVLMLRQFNCQIASMHRANAVCFFVVAMVSMLIPCSIGNLALLISHQINEINRYTYLAWWMGDTLGVLLAAPFLLSMTRQNINQLLIQKNEALIIFAITLSIALIIFPFNNLNNGFHLPIVYTAFICITWTALRLGILGSAFCTICFSFIAIWSTVNNLGPFTFADTHISYYLIWFYTSSLTFVGFMITTANAEIAHKSAALIALNKSQDAQKTHLDAIIQTIPDLLFEIDRDGICISANGTSPIPEFSPTSILGKQLSQIIPQKILPTWNKAINEADSWGLSQGIMLEFDHVPKPIWFELSISKCLGAYHANDSFICLARDISKRLYDHQSDLANEKRFRSIFESTTNIAVQGYNRYHEVIFWNKASEELYGYDANDVMGKKLEDLIIPDFMRTDVYNAIENWHLLNQPIPSGEIPLRDAKNNEVWVYSNHVLVQTPDDKEMYCLDIDLGPQRRALVRVEQELQERKQIEIALRESEKRLKSAQLMTRVAHWSWDVETDNYSFNPSMMEIFSLPKQQLEGKLKKFIASLIETEDRKTVRIALQESLNNNSQLSVEFRINIDQRQYWLSAKGSVINNVNNQIIEGTVQDITERKRLDLALRAAAADSASAPIFFESLLKSLMDAIGAKRVFISIINPQDNEFSTTHTHLFNGTSQHNFEFQTKDTPFADAAADNFYFIKKNANGIFPDNQVFQQYHVESYLSALIKNTDGLPMGMLVALSEKPLPVSPQVKSLMLIFAERISGELRRANDQTKIFNLAFFDPLTGLPNRRMMRDRLKLITAQSARSGQHGALLFIDIDHFKLLNDTRGHHIGDQLLAQVAARIISIIRETDLAVRLGGDEFVVVFDNLGIDAETAAIEAKHRAEQLHELMSLPYPLQQSIFHCTISIGVNLFSSHTTSIDDLLRHADVAMYQAKDSGRNAIRFFDPKMQSHLEKRAAIETDLRLAHDAEDQLVSYYQIQVDKDGKAIGAELLLRWIHPEKGMIPPSDFIPVAEQTGLIVSIGKQVIRNACAQIHRWSRNEKYAALTLAVNVSPIQFNQSSFVNDVLDIVRTSEINPQLLKLELTESSLLKNIDQSIEKMQQLQKHGIAFSMDDFGIGYSSLSYLKRLPLYQLKIDQSFVRDIASDPNDAVIVCTIISMAQNMKLNVIAEGVETEEQKLFLEQNGCPMFQGYYFGYPVPIQQFEEQLKRYL